MIEIEIGNRNEIVVTTNGRALGYVRSIQLDHEVGLSAKVAQSTSGDAADTVRALVAHGFEVTLILADESTIVAKPTSDTQMYCSYCGGYHLAAEDCPDE